MKVKEVLIKYHKIVPFPVTVKKIQKAGREPGEFLKQIAKELENCDDIKTDPLGGKFLDCVRKIKQTTN